MTAAAMCRHLEDRHGIQVAIEAGNDLRHFDPAAAILRINAGQPDSGIRFQLAYHIATSSLHAEIDDIARSAHLKTTTARELLKVGLANYAAGAVLMPYEAFRRAARVPIPVRPPGRGAASPNAPATRASCLRGPAPPPRP